jgi:alkylhydroperoxidase family enzyme
MTYISTIPPSQATGPLKAQYDLSLQRDGRIATIIQAMSQNPAALTDLITLYTTISRGPSGLSRAQREMIAVVVSKANGCHY